MKSKWWHEEATKYAFNHQSGSRDAQFAKMRFAFVDSNGKRYFRYINEDDTPLERMEQMQIILQELGNRIKHTDLDLWCEAVLKLLNDDRKKTRLTDAGNMVMALQKRRELLYEPELLMKMCSALYIREDQDPTIWDDEFEAIKIEQFKKDRKTGLYDFFYRAGLGNFLPSFQPLKSESVMEMEMTNQIRQMEAFNDFVTTVLSS